ncbi:MAG: tetratricopeptide repeat protein [Terriglobia bacterium]
MMEEIVELLVRQRLPWVYLIAGAVVSILASLVISFLMRSRRELSMVRREVLAARSALQRVRPGPDPRSSIVTEIERLARELKEIRSGSIEKGKLRALINEQLGRHYFDRRQLREAIEHFERALEEDPTLVDSLNFRAFSRGLLSRSMERAEKDKPLEDAEKDARRAVELDPKRGDVYNTLGWVLDEKGHFDEAIGAYQKALDLDPSFHVAAYNIACTLAKAGRYDQALETLARAIRNQGSLREDAARDPDFIETLGRDPRLGSRFAALISDAPKT